MKLILCVEDEPGVLENNRKAFTDAGYAVLTAESLAKAREYLASQTPDAIVLDIMLPDGLGLDLLTEIREKGGRVPVIMLTAWDKPSDVARGLRLGANDYLSKPFAYEVLLARVETMFRNVEQMPERITRGTFSIDVLSSRALLNGEDLRLKPTEFSLLLVLVQNEGRAMSAADLYKKAWNLPLTRDKNALYTAISKLRKRIEPAGYDILLDRSDGYYFTKR
jgi:DNA-binding response OmpR family regulator